MSHTDDLYRDTVQRVFDAEIGNIKNRLGVKTNITLDFTATSDAIMFVTKKSIISSSGASRVILHTSTDGIIHVDLLQLKCQSDDLRLVCGTAKVVEDFIFVLLCHECRHIWQIESQWFKGKTLNKDKSCVHGMLEQEQDANNWMLNFANGKQKLLAEYVIASTNALDINTKALEISKAYNPEWFEIIMKTLKGGE